MTPDDNGTTDEGSVVTIDDAISDGLVVGNDISTQGAALTGMVWTSEINKGRDDRKLGWSDIDRQNLEFHRNY